MKKAIAIISILLVAINLQAQVGGISASKLMTICTETVPASSIEFEPSLAFCRSQMEWNNSGNRKSIFANTDSAVVESFLAFRFSYGLAKNLEIGISVSEDISNTSWGLKYKFLNSRNTSLAVIAGLYTPIGNRTTDKNQKLIENSLAGGLVISHCISSKFSLDADIQYQRHLFEQVGNHQQDIFINTDFGYYVVKKIQLVSGLNFVFSDGINQQYSLIFNSGITVEKAENFILVVQIPNTILGKNTKRSIGFGLALTILID